MSRILLIYVRRNAPEIYRAESEALRDYYGRKLLGIRHQSERRAIGREYAQARIAMVIRLARTISNQT